MADGHGTAGQQQFQRHGPAHMVGGADHHGVAAKNGLVRALQQLHDAVRRAGAQHRQAHREPPDVIRMKTVHVLGRMNAFNHCFGVDVRR